MAGNQQANARDMPFAVCNIPQNIWIPIADGSRLAAHFASRGCGVDAAERTGYLYIVSIRDDRTLSRRIVPAAAGNRLAARVSVGGRIPFKHVAHAPLPGPKLRVAISTGYWPVACRCRRHPPAGDALALFPLPAPTPTPTPQSLRPPTHRRRIVQDVDGGAVEVGIVDAGVDVEGALTNLPAIDLDLGTASQTISSAPQRPTVRGRRGQAADAVSAPAVVGARLQSHAT